MRKRFLTFIVDPRLYHPNVYLMNDHDGVVKRIVDKQEKGNVYKLLWSASKKDALLQIKVDCPLVQYIVQCILNNYRPNRCPDDIENRPWVFDHMTIFNLPEKEHG